jgi:hypothetical protein
MTNILGGILIVLTYILYLPKVQTKLLWGGISENLQRVFLTSIFISAVAFIVGVITLATSNQVISNVFCLGLTMFIIGSSLWAPMLMKNDRFFVFIALTMTTIGLLLMVMESHSRIATICFLVVFLHALIMDNVVWYSEYLKVSKK